MLYSEDFVAKGEKVTLLNVMKGSLETVLYETGIAEWPELLRDGIVHMAGQTYDPAAFLSQLGEELQAAIPEAVEAVRRRLELYDRADAALATLPAEGRSAVREAYGR